MDLKTIEQITRLIKGISPGEALSLFQMAVPRKLKANEVYIAANDRSRKLAYIEKGVIRTYAVKENGEEATLFIRWEEQFIASHDTIILEQPSRFIYRALEETNLLEIDYDELEKIMREKPAFEPLRIFFLMKMLAESLAQVELFVLFSPEERYQRLLEERFNIVNRVPDKYLASMLGITPVSLSRIRKRLRLKQK